MKLLLVSALIIIAGCCPCPEYVMDDSTEVHGHPSTRESTTIRGHVYLGDRVAYA